ncbi:MAG: peptide-methionine (S)-S-oxide reductase MsrA [Candidatus Baltobacteraceae bacterium]
MSATSETATFAAGCFWGVEAAFRQVPGVSEVTSGYTGGNTASPSYGEVCSGTTNHAEAVRITFDPQHVSYEKLLEIFWQIHDPTTMNRQGPDVGSQYRSAIFVHDESQRAAALASLEREQANQSRSIVTQVTDSGPFYDAEEYHQRYFEKNGGAACHIQL